MSGQWILEGLDNFPVTLRNEQSFGHNFSVIFHWRYLAPAAGARTFFRDLSLQEMPRLEWGEEITVINTANNGTTQYWRFNVNMYAHKPSSQTLKVWLQRYVRAYDYVASGSVGSEANTYEGRSGFVSLLSLNGQSLQLNDLGGPQVGNEEKANLVRRYITEHGCQMKIRIDDRPCFGGVDEHGSIEQAIALFPANPPSGTHRRRLVRFNIGAEGTMAPRLRAYQYLDVDATVNPSRWNRDFGMHSVPGYSLLDTNGVTQVQPPFHVANQEQYLRMDGEYR